MGEGQRGTKTDQYFDCEEVNSNFTIISQNIRSFGKNRNNLVDCISRIKSTKIILLQELWKPSPQKIPGFQQIEGKYRNIRNGGGVGVIVEQGLNYTLIDTPFDESVFESIGIEIQLNRKSITLINVYCPKKLPVKVVTEYLESILTNIDIGKSVTIAGDFNIDISNGNNSDFIDIMASYGFASLINDYTRVTDTSSTTIDLMFTNDSTIDAGIIPLEISDHYTIFGTLETKKGKRSFKEKPLCDKRSMEYMRDWLKIVDWKPVLEDNTITTFEKFDSVLDEARKVCCPNVKVGTKTRLSQPWFTAGLKVSRQNKDKLAKKARIKKGIHKEKYLIYRRLYHKLIKIAKHQYYKKLFIQYKNDPKMLWSTANEVVG